MSHVLNQPQEFINSWNEWMKLSEVNVNTELSCGLTAQSWMNEGIYPQEREAWLDVNGFDPERCAELQLEGIDPSDVSGETKEGDGGYAATIAYKFCNGDLTMEEVRQLIEE